MGAGQKVRCRKCGDVIQSQHRHDFRGCKCGAIAVDGGDSYLRIVAKDLDDAEEVEEDAGDNDTEQWTTD